MRTLLILLAVLSGSGQAAGEDFHLTPEGGGNRDGKSWEHALDQSALHRVINETMQPGDRLLLGGGTYRNLTLVISEGGSAERPKTIVGVDRGAGLPVLAGNWSVDTPTKGGTALRLEPGVSHLVIEGLRIQHYTFGVHAPPVAEKAARSNLVFRDVDIEQFRYGFYLADCDDLQFDGCDLRRYTKHGFRWDQGCDRVSVRQCTADCSEGDEAWEKKTELFPFGFVVTDGGAPNTQFVFEDCLARNHLMPLQQKKYKNGDGFVVEANSADVTFVRCRALRNQDGGFDLKVPNVRLTGCVATGNKRAIRIWNGGQLENCFVGWSTTGLWSNGAAVTANRCTFHALTEAAVMTDDRATEPLTLQDCLISGSAKPFRKTARGEIVSASSVVAALGDSEADPQYVRPAANWDGLGDALNSRAYLDKGYRGDLPESRRVSGR